jgi:endonuclease/exonuclease/phosphatase (EEP) superfamily protein YafD
MDGLSVQIALDVAGVAVVVTTVLPFIRKGYWWVRVWDFPRLQIAMTGALVLLGFLLWPPATAVEQLILGALAIAVAYQAYRIYPFTPIAPVQVLSSDDPDPAIVAGDLNDVAWSYTTQLFQRISGLIDPRLGRGLFNTYHARIPIMRWPLDHIFFDPEFRLCRIERQGFIGSDHFPILVELSFEPEGADEHEARAPMPRDRAEARRMIRQAKASGMAPARPSPARGGIAPSGSRHPD